MRSSTSSSDPARWGRFFRRLVLSAVVLGVVLYGFVVVVDPWDSLPLSPTLPRVPVSTNARFTFPALARSQVFDSAVIGTSTSRLLQPGELDALFGGTFVNLSMNAARAYEQTRMVDVFAAAHPQARTVIVGLDETWCAMGAQYQRLTPRPFPEWMYEANRWGGYREMFGLYPLQEAVSQFAVMIGVKRSRYGLDGFTEFTPPEADYDAARAHGHIVAEGRMQSLGGDLPLDRLDFPGLLLLRSMLGKLPVATEKILFFVPYYVGFQGLDTAAGPQWAECKKQVAGIAAGVANTLVVDFMQRSAMTIDETHYWDAHHYRMPIATQLGLELWQAARGGVPKDGAVLERR